MKMVMLRASSLTCNIAIRLLSASVNKPHILVVDDDDRLRSLLVKYLTDSGFLVTAADSAAAARRKLGEFIFDLMILDVMMPNETGLSFLASIKENKIPTLMLSAMGEAEDRIKGLEIGADDYLTKPFEPKELLLRIQTILRRTMGQPAKTQFIKFGDFCFDLTTLALKRGDELINLTSSEAALLKILAQHAGNTVSREEMAKLMPSVVSERSIDVQMSRLRKKIEESDANSQSYLKTIRGAGYVLYAS